MARTRKHELPNTRARIVGAACDKFREDGFDGASIADIMVSAGMTHGAFYGYFSSKDDLIIASIEEEFGRYPAAIDIETTIQNCLGHITKDLVSIGCTAVVLLPEVARCSPQVKKVFQGKIEQLLLGLSSSLEGNVAKPRSTAMAVFAAIVGSLHLARAVGGSETSREILAAGAEAARMLTKKSTSTR